MVLTQSQIDSEMPGLQLSSRSGYLTDVDVAKHTLDMDDTGEDVAAQGFVDGYEHLFSDQNAPFGPSILTRGYLWDTPDSARVFIRHQMEDAQRLEGSQLPGGITLTEFQGLKAPEVGEDAVAFRVTGTIADYQTEVVTTLLMWRRGPVVATVGVLSFDDEDRSAIVGRLAQQMDHRIDGVLAGQIVAGPFVPTPVPQVTPRGATTPRPIEDSKLTAMLLTLADLPTGAVITSEGPAETTDATQSYGRRFGPAGATMQLGPSEVTEVRVTVEIYASDAIARAPIEIIRSMGPEWLGQLLQESDAGKGGTNVEPVDIPQIGDASAALMVRMETPAGKIEAHTVHVSRAQVRAQLLVVGPAGKVFLDDVVALAQLLDQRIRDGLP